MQVFPAFSPRTTRAQMKFALQVHRAGRRAGRFPAGSSCVLCVVRCVLSVVCCKLKRRPADRLARPAQSNANTRSTLARHLAERPAHAAQAEQVAITNLALHQRSFRLSMHQPTSLSECRGIPSAKHCQCFATDSGTSRRWFAVGCQRRPRCLNHNGARFKQHTCGELPGSPERLGMQPTRTDPEHEYTPKRQFL